MRQPWLRVPLADQLARVAPHLSAGRLVETVTAAPDSELEAARDELQALIGILSSLRLTIEAMIGRSAVGLAATPHPNDLDPGMQRKLLLGWLSLRQLPEVRQGLHMTTQTAETIAPRSTFVELTRSAARRQLPREIELPRQGTEEAHHP